MRAKKIVLKFSDFRNGCVTVCLVGVTTQKGFLKNFIDNVLVAVAETDGELAAHRVKTERSLARVRGCVWLERRKIYLFLEGTYK